VRVEGKKKLMKAIHFFQMMTM